MSVNGSGEDLVLFEQRGGVAYVILNRPHKLNAINFDLGMALYERLTSCGADESIRAIVLAGAGRAFCAGDELGRVRTPVELRSLERGAVRHYVEGPGRWTSCIRLMQQLPQPVVAKVQGFAYGAGFNLALGADFRIMASSAKMATPFIKRGIASGTNQLQKYIGIGAALEMVLTGEPVDAEEALQLRLVNRVAPDENLDAAVDEFAAALAAGPTGAIALSKAAVYRGWDLGPEEALWHQGSATTASNSLEDRQEGLNAFLEKRAPRFVGR